MKNWTNCLIFKKIFFRINEQGAYCVFRPPFSFNLPDPKENSYMIDTESPVDLNCFQQGNCHQLFFKVDDNNLRCFFGFLQHGFFVKIDVGKNLLETLNDQFGIDSDYAVNRIKTVFYNGRPVDNMKTAILHNGASLAFSAAMPGLVGATLRSGGVLSPFRASISFRGDDTNAAENKKGVVFIKLFNLLIPEIGPFFLGHGILIEKMMLNSFLKDQTTNFWNHCQSVFLDDLSIDSEKLIQTGVPGTDKWVFIIVKT